MDNMMFCYQCQETAKGEGCTVSGVCGKKPEVAAIQDLLIYVTKGLSVVTTRLRKEGKAVEKEVNHMVTRNLFTTITNASFDYDAIAKDVEKTLAMKEKLLTMVETASDLPAAALWHGAVSEYASKASSDEVGVLSTKDEDIRSLREIITYGLKGLSAYSKHANALMQAPVVISFNTCSSNLVGSTTICTFLMVEPSLSAMKSTALELRCVRTQPLTQTSLPYSVLFSTSIIFVLFIFLYLLDILDLLDLLDITRKLPYAGGQPPPRSGSASRHASGSS